MTSGTNYRWVMVIAAALLSAVVTAVVTPRFSDEGDVDWIVTIGVALIVAGLVALLTREKTTKDGAHVRDDALGPDR